MINVASTQKKQKKIEHIFWSYNKISKLWEDLNNWIFKKKLKQNCH